MRELEPCGSLRIIDLFCGAGGLSLGAKNAAFACGLRPHFELAADSDTDVLDVYVRNFSPKKVSPNSVATLVDFHVEGIGQDARFSYAPEILDSDIANQHGAIHLLLAGPPCQGHSNLNNRTRRHDPRNSLYLTVPAFAVAMDIPALIIENVPEVANDRRGVLATAKGLLENLRYAVQIVKLKGTDLGVAQSRTRLFLIAVKRRTAPIDLELDKLLDLVLDKLRRPLRPVSWAIGDLVDVDGPTVFDKPSKIDKVNMERIDWLHDNDEFDLPNTERPECHRNGHTYKSVYGRMHWDKPAMTITQGFSVAGRGRYVHALRRRTLTPHEAARIQGFPDSFKFKTRLDRCPPRSALTKMIGNAVPPAFSEACTFAVLASLLTPAEGLQLIQQE